MNIFKVSQEENNHPDAIKSFVCYALRESEAADLNPCETDRDQWADNKESIEVLYLGSKTNAPRNHIICKSKS